MKALLWSLAEEWKSSTTSSRVCHIFNWFNFEAFKEWLWPTSAVFMAVTLFWMHHKLLRWRFSVLCNLPNCNLCQLLTFLSIVFSIEWYKYMITLYLSKGTPCCLSLSLVQMMFMGHQRIKRAMNDYLLLFISLLLSNLFRWKLNFCGSFGCGLCEIVNRLFANLHAHSCDQIVLWSYLWTF